MELFIELLVEMILEGCVELGTEKHVPMPVRIIALLIVMFFYVGMVAVFFIIGINAINEAKTALGIIMIAMSLVCAVGFAYAVGKSIRKRR